jgi:hypothetical protein
LTTKTFTGLHIFSPADWQCKNKGITMKTAGNQAVQQKKKIMRVRELNDALRWNIFMPTGGEVILTAGVVALKNDDHFALLSEIQCFEDFNEGNDPYGEHDFGRIDFRGERYFFKIDYFDPSGKFHSADKSNPQLTRRVLTIMRADEY